MEPISGADILDAVADANLDLAILRYDARDVQIAAQLENRDYVVIHVDSLVYYEAPKRISESKPSSLKLVEVEISAGYLDLVACIFAGYQNHYSANPATSDLNLSEVYRDWTIQSAKRPGVSILEAQLPSSVAVGMAVVDSSKGDRVEILLAGIAQSARRRGFYSEMLNELVRIFSGNDRTIEISSQTANIGVARAWARLGWLPARVMNTLHVMPRDAWNRLGKSDRRE